MRHMSQGRLLILISLLNVFIFPQSNFPIQSILHFRSHMHILLYFTIISFWISISLLFVYHIYICTHLLIFVHVSVCMHYQSLAVKLINSGW